MTALTLAWAARSDTGPVRDHNEDAVFASPRMVAVADGVGGEAAGEVASQAAINALAHVEKLRNDGALGDALAGAVAEGNKSIAFIAGVRPSTAGMATTLTVVALDGDCWTVANLGDSRAYLLRDGVLMRLTRDDSFVQELVDAGMVGEDEARVHPQRNVVTGVLDGAPDREPTIGHHRAQPGDRVLVCSDGLSDVVADEAIARILATPAREDAAAALLETALHAGARDNVSLVVADALPA
jgi:PPM family protein phosphatase